VLEKLDLVADFGDAYRVYQRQVPMLVPWVRPPGRGGHLYHPASAASTKGTTIPAGVRTGSPPSVASVLLLLDVRRHPVRRAAFALGIQPGPEVLPALLEPLRQILPHLLRDHRRRRVEAPCVSRLDAVTYHAQAASSSSVTWYLKIRPEKRSPSTKAATA